MKSTPKHNSARHAFFYLTSFFTLALAATAVGTLCFQIINFYFPQPEQNVDFSQSAIKFGLSTLIVAAPVFFFVTRIINRSLSHKDLDADSGVRRWLTYIVMFIAIAVSAGDLISVFYNFLEGELSARFFLKALIIFLIAGGIFLYFFLDMRSDSDDSRRQKAQAWAALFWGAVLIPFVWTFFIMEPPAQARARQIDQETTSNLEGFRSAIDSYYMQTQRIPASVADISTPQYDLPNMDWLDQHGFKYRPTGTRNYELCAVFERDTNEDKPGTDPYKQNTPWDHPKGQHCFALQAYQDPPVNNGNTKPLPPASTFAPQADSEAGVPGVMEPVPVF